MSAAVPVPNEGRRPLGEVLVDRGIVTPEQLAVALEEQRSTGKQLGEIIVALGFAPGPIVAQALATQHGGMIKTEYGFATGWSTGEAPAPVAPPAQADSSAELANRDRTIAELRAWSEQAQAAIDSRDDAIAGLQAALAEQRATATPAADQVAREEALESLEAELKARAEETDAVRAELKAESARHASTQAKLAASSEAAALHEAETARAAKAQATSEHEVATARRALADLERRLENARSRADTLARRITEQDEELETLRAAPLEEPNRWASATTHYVLRRSSEGYDLVEHDGPPPAVGDTVDGLRVARVGPAGPGLAVACAYLAD